MNRRPPVRLAECRDCAGPVVWITLDTGSRMMLDPLPLDHGDERGNVAGRVVGGRLHGWVVSKAHPIGVHMLRMRPHVATCPAVPRKSAEALPPTLF